MFQKIEELLFGNPRIIWDTHLNGYESHVDRKMNVWGSGGAHQNYFRKVDKVIEEFSTDLSISSPLVLPIWGVETARYLPISST